MLRGFKVYALVIIVAISGLATGVVFKETDMKVLPPQVYLEIETNQDSFGLDDNVNVTVKLINNELKEVAFDFEMDHQYDLMISNSEGIEVFNLFENFTVHNDSTRIMLAPKSKEVLLEEYIWNRADKSGKQVSSGNYTIHSKLVGYNISDEKQISVDEHREVYIRVLTDKNVYRKGENVNNSAYLINEEDENITFRMSSGCGIYAPVLYYRNDFIVYVKDLSCTMAMWYWEIASKGIDEGTAYFGRSTDGVLIGKTRNLGLFGYTWNQINDTGDRIRDESDHKWIIPEYYVQVPSGIYTIPYRLGGVPVESAASDQAISLGYEIVGFKTILIY